MKVSPPGGSAAPCTEGSPEGGAARAAYFAARGGLQALVEERAKLFAGITLDEFRRWLAARVGARWLELEGLVHRARDADLALSMWWEREMDAGRLVPVLRADLVAVFSASVVETFRATARGNRRALPWRWLP